MLSRRRSVGVARAVRRQSAVATTACTSVTPLGTPPDPNHGMSPALEGVTADLPTPAGPEKRPFAMGRIGLWTVILLLLALALLARWPSLHQPVNRDIAAYATIGARMHHGEWPYRDLFDHKQPLIYAVFWTLAAIAPRSNAAIQVAAALVAGIGGVIVFLRLRRVTGFASALGSSLLLVTLGASRFVEGIDLNTEHLLSTLLCLAVLLPLACRRPVTRWMAFTLGVICAIAVLAKVVAIFAFPAVLLALFVRSGSTPGERWRTLSAFAFGIALSAAGLLGLFWQGGALRELLWANIDYNLAYVAANRLKSGAPAVPLPIYCLLGLGCAVVALRLWRTRGNDWLSWTLLLWLIAAVAGAKLGRGNFPHYFAPIVPPALICCCLPIPFSGRKTGRIFGWVRGAAVALAAFPFLQDIAQNYTLTPQQLGMRMFGPQSAAWNYQEEVGRWIRERAQPGDRLFVVGAEPGFYWQSGLKPATRYLYEYAEVGVPNFTDQLNETLGKNPPAFVVMPARWDRPYLEWLQPSLYRIALTGGPVTVFARRDHPSSRAATP